MQQRTDSHTLSGVSDISFDDCIDDSESQFYSTRKDLAKPPQSSTEAPEASFNYQSWLESSYGVRFTLECPIRRLETRQQHPHTCIGLSAQSMSDVRRHLRRSHACFVNLCHVCQEDVLDSEVFRVEHGRFCTTVQSKRRGNTAQQRQWDDLYLKLCSNLEVCCSFKRPVIA